MLAPSSRPRTLSGSAGMPRCSTRATGSPPTAGSPREESAMYQQVLDPVGDSLFLSALVAMIPLATLFVLLGGLKLRAHFAGLGARWSRSWSPSPSTGCRSARRWRPRRGRRVRPVPDHVDRLERDLDLQHDRRHRPLRGAAALVRDDLGRPAHPGRDHRLLLRRAARGARRLRTPVAITAVMLIAVGFTPMKAAAVALVANTAPVAFGRSPCRYHARRADRVSRRRTSGRCSAARRRCSRCSSR